MASAMTTWFLVREGIDMAVISADIQRYLGPDAHVRPALVRPSVHRGDDGYWVTSYCYLTPEMIQELRLDSQRWSVEKEWGLGKCSTEAVNRVERRC